MRKKKIYEQVMEYSAEERNSVVAGGNKFFVSLLCAVVAILLFFIGFIMLLDAGYINFSNKGLGAFIPVIISLILILIPFIWVKAKYPLYKEERYHYINAIKKKMKLMNIPFDNDDMYKSTVSKFSQPMEWYGSLVMFIMFIWIFIDLTSGISYITGIIYGSTTNMTITAEQMYNKFGTGLQMLDIFVGIASVASAVLSVFAWKALKNFKKSAPKLIVSVYAIGFISSIIYFIGLYAIGIDGLERAVPALAINAAFLVGNAIYFRKRSAWFVH